MCALEREREGKKYKRGKEEVGAGAKEKERKNEMGSLEYQGKLEGLHKVGGREHCAVGLYVLLFVWVCV